MIVRRPFSSHFDAVTQLLSNIKSDLDRQTVVASSGIEVQDIDDAAGLWREIDNLTQSRVNLDAYLDNGERAENMLRVADVALDEGAELLAQARALAVYLANDSFGADERIEQAIEVDRMVEGLVQIGNAQYGERFVFAGTAYDAPAFDSTGAYLGNADLPRTQVSDTQYILTGFDGGASIEPAIATLQAFADALRTGERSAISDQIERLDDAFQGLVTSRQQVGYEQSDVERINTLTRSLQVTVDEATNQLVAADPIEALTRFSELQNAYQIALQVTARRGATTLFEFL